MNKKQIRRKLKIFSHEVLFSFRKLKSSRISENHAKLFVSVNELLKRQKKEKKMKEKKGTLRYQLITNTCFSFFLLSIFICYLFLLHLL